MKFASVALLLFSLLSYAQTPDISPAQSNSTGTPTGPPNIVLGGLDPANPTELDSVTLTAFISDDGVIMTASLFYSPDGIVFDSTAMTNLAGILYQGVIPPHPPGTTVHYFVTATDDENLTAVSDTLTYTVLGSTPGGPHLLISEFAVTPTAGEFVEIYNPTDSVIDLSNYYLTDATFAGSGAYYYNIVTGNNAGGGTAGDFHARFPAGATIAPGEAQTIAMNGSDFVTTYSISPTYELYDTDGNIPDMLEALPGSINGQGGLTNSGEVLILYFWDGQSDLVQDVDYVVWGDKAEAVDKSGVSIDGPDPDNTPSTYLNDTDIASQIAVSSGQPHDIGETSQRLDLMEHGETLSAGNGITGHNETSENLATSFQVGAPNPGFGPGGPTPPSITQVTHSPSTPTPSDPVTVTAIIKDNGVIVNARLHVSINGAAFDSTDMSPVSGDTTYQATIPAQPESTTVAYFVSAVDNDGLRATSATVTYTVFTPSQGTPHLLISEIVVTPTDGEFVEIYNPTDNPIDLSDYYLTDATFAGGGTYYYNIVTGSNAGGGDFGDFHARFPAGASIAPGEAQTVAMNGSGFVTTYGINPTYELYDTDGNIPDMLEALPGSINGQGGLTNSGEIVILYFWDGQSDLVQDVDYVVWGDKAEAVDKSGVSIDGPDPDNTPSTYLNDTPIAQQISMSDADPHTFGESVQRLSTTEFGEREFGGNGITGHDETSEDLASAFQVGVPTPGVGPAIGGQPQITAVTFSPSEPTDQDPITFTVNAFDPDGTIVSAQLFYSVNSQPTITIDMTPLADTTFQATIPAQPNYSVVQYFVQITDNDNNTVSSDPATLIIGASNGIIPIRSIQENPQLFEGQTVTVEGVVTLGAGITVLDRTDAYIQDASGRGINLFSFDPPNTYPNIQRFNRLRVTGTVTEFNGVTEITNFTPPQTIAENQPLPEPFFVSTNLANDLTFEGTYMKVSGIVNDIAEAGGGTNITLQDDQGTVLIRVWNTTNINLAFINIGDTLTVTGVMDVFQGAAQIVPGYPDEIILPGKTARADGSGIAFVSQTAVDSSDTLSTFTVSLVGVVDDTIAEVRIDIPWKWHTTGTFEPTLTGEGVGNAHIQTAIEPIDSIVQVFISNTTITRGDTANFTFNQLLTPREPVNSVFWIRTAGKQGRLKLITDVPKIAVAGGGRYLIYDLQVNSAEFSGNVTVQGVTTIGAGLLRKTSSAGDSLTTAYIQDESHRGINLFRFGLIDPLLQRGNLVQVSGTVTEFNGVTEIEYTDISLLAEGAPLPKPVKLTNSQVNSPRWDGTLLTTEGIILEKFSAGGGTSLEIGDGEGQTTIRVWDTAELDLSEFNENLRIFAEGVGGLFISNGDTIYQILTTYQDQLRIDPNYTPSLDNVSLSVEPHPFVPDRGEHIDIRYNAGAVNNHITIRIFDMAGRLITTLLDENALILENTLSWDGRDRLFDRVPLGTYICHLEVVEPVSGKKRTRMAPIVVGTVLSR